MTTGEIMTLLRARGYVFNRALGQHFLVDDDVIESIVCASEVDGQTNVLEIGPGAGMLTGPLCATARHVLAIELDRELMPVLETVLLGRRNVRVVRGDVMREDIAQLARDYFDGAFDVVSNLPYSITTPVLMRLLSEKLPIRRITVMIQAEAAERVLASSGREYGPLSILAQYKTRVERAIEVPRECFYPKPNVDSAVLKLTFAEPEIPALDESHLFRLVNASFAMRRKTLANNLKSIVPSLELANLLASCGIDARARAEQVSVWQFVRMSNELLGRGIVKF